MVAFLNKWALIPGGQFMESIFPVCLGEALHFGEFLMCGIVFNDGVLIEISDFFLKVPGLFFSVLDKTIWLRNGFKGRLGFVGMEIGWCIVEQMGYNTFIAMKVLVVPRQSIAFS